jgi:MerR family transcriptional regulator, copper efflux regulator
MTGQEYVFLFNFIFVMLINQLAKASGFSKDTIRYYEKIRLVELPKSARRENNYKDYPDEVLHTLQSVRNLKKLGFTLEEIREIIVRRQMDALDSISALKIIEQKIIHLDSQIDKLQQYRHQLQIAQMLVHGEKVNHIFPLTEMSMCA